MRLIARFGVVVFALATVVVGLPSTVGAAPSVSGAVGAGAVQAKVTPFGTNGDYHVTITLLGVFAPDLFPALPGSTPEADYDCSATACPQFVVFATQGFGADCDGPPDFRGPLYVYTMNCFADWNDPSGYQQKEFNLALVMYSEPRPDILPGTPPGTSVFNGVFAAAGLPPAQ